MDDVAAAAGVSRTTVSRVLGDGQNVRIETVASVMAAVRRTGYVVNQHARSLAAHSSRTVAFILCAPYQRLAEDLSFNILLSECTRELTAHQLALFLAVADDPGQRARICEYVAGGEMAGALIVPARPGCPLIDELRASKVAVVAYGVPPGQERDVACVTTDDRAGAREMVRHLRDSGRHTIATIAGLPDTAGGTERLAGWRDVLGTAATDRLVATGDYTCTGGRAAMAQLLELAPGLDAVFAASDLMAAGALATLRLAGRRVPDDVAIGAFGDSTIATTVEPPLTTVRQPLPRIGREMVRLLLEQIDGQPPAASILPTELIIRDSG